MERYTKLYDWVMESELSQPEALVFSRVLMWGDRGCFESAATMAKKLKMTPRSVQRIIKRLVHREWLAVLPESKHRRTIYADPKRLTAGPLFRGLGVRINKKLEPYDTGSQVATSKPKSYDTGSVY